MPEKDPDKTHSRILDDIRLAALNLSEAILLAEGYMRAHPSPREDELWLTIANYIELASRPLVMLRYDFANVRNTIGTIQ